MICISFLKILGYLKPYNPPPHLPAYKSPTPSSFPVPGPARLILNAYYKRSIANKEGETQRGSERRERERSFLCPPCEGHSSVPSSDGLDLILLRVRGRCSAWVRQICLRIPSLPLTCSVASSKLLNLSEADSPSIGFLWGWNDFLEAKYLHGTWHLTYRYSTDATSFPAGPAPLGASNDAKRAAVGICY